MPVRRLELIGLAVAVLVPASLHVFPRGRARSAYRVSVTTYGTKADGVTDDSAAMQAALDSVPVEGGTVFVPAGIYRIGTALVIRKGRTSITGHGTRSVLRLVDGVEQDIFIMPTPQSRVGDYPSPVTDISISRLTLDGNYNGHLATGPLPSFFAIQIYRAERVDMAELWIKDFPYDGITVSNGNHPSNDITVHDSHISGIGRNGLHFGYGRNLRASRMWIEDTPSQHWGPHAGSSIDIEVEGKNSFVDGVTIEDSILERGATTTTAGDGVAMQNAFGPISNVTVQRNVIHNHQVGVQAYVSTNTIVRDNWIVDDAGLNVAGYGIEIINSAAKLSNNVLNLLRAPNVRNGISISQGHDVSVTGNHIFGSRCALRLTQSRSGLSVEKNTVANQFDCSVEPDASSTPGLAQVSNNLAPVGSVDQTPPTAVTALASGTTISAPTRITIKAKDAGVGVARVFFFVDGIPERVVKSPPYVVIFEPGRYPTGPHTLSVRAVDNAANLGALASVDITDSSR